MATESRLYSLCAFAIRQSPLDVIEESRSSTRDLVGSLRIQAQVNSRKEGAKGRRRDAAQDLPVALQLVCKSILELSGFDDELDRLTRLNGVGLYGFLSPSQLTEPPLRWSLLTMILSSCEGCRNTILSLPSLFPRRPIAANEVELSHTTVPASSPFRVGSKETSVDQSRLNPGCFCSRIEGECSTAMSWGPPRIAR
jgi:hypothetical protein